MYINTSWRNLGSYMLVRNTMAEYYIPHTHSHTPSDQRQEMMHTGTWCDVLEVWHQKSSSGAAGLNHKDVAFEPSFTRTSSSASAAEPFRSHGVMFIELNYKTRQTQNCKMQKKKDIWKNSWTVLWGKASVTGQEKTSYGLFSFGGLQGIKNKHFIFPSFSSDLYTISCTWYRKSKLIRYTTHITPRPWSCQLSICAIESGLWLWPLTLCFVTLPCLPVCGTSMFN